MKILLYVALALLAVSSPLLFLGLVVIVGVPLAIGRFVVWVSTVDQVPKESVPPYRPRSAYRRSSIPYKARRRPKARPERDLSTYGSSRSKNGS